MSGGREYSEKISEAKLKLKFILVVVFCFCFCFENLTLSQSLCCLNKVGTVTGPSFQLRKQTIEKLNDSVLLSSFGV